MARHRRNHDHSSRLEQPRTFAEAQQGFQERGLTLPRLTDDERDHLEGDVELISRWRTPWTGSLDSWLELNDMMRREIAKMRNPCSSTSSTSDEYWEHLASSRRLAAPGISEHAGGHQSDMSPSHYASEPRSSDAESRALVPYNTHRSRRNAGGSRDNGRTTRNQGGGASGYPYNGHGNSRRQEGRNARHPVLQSGDGYFPDNAGYSRADSPERDFLRSTDATEQASASSWESDSSRGPDATHSRVQAWVHDTSIRHRPGCTLADSGVRDAGPFPSSRSRRGYVDASTQTR